MIESDNPFVTEKPKLLNIANKGDTIKLNTYAILEDDTKKLLVSDEFDYVVYHHASHVIKNASEIVSVSSEGYAKYNKEGYVSVKAKLKDGSLESDEIIIATGNVYGDPEKASVIGVFPQNYIPEGSPYSFGDMFEKYSDYMKIVDLAYGIESDLYSNFKPFGGDKQIFALLNIPNGCGGNMNPLETAPCCYMNCGDGSPQYDVVIHEMGHNFAYSKGMDQLLHSDNDRINKAGFGECVASLPVQYTRAKILKNPQNYDISEDSFEYLNWALFQNQDNLWNKERLERLENYINEGDTKGIFDINSLTPEKRDSLQGNVGAFCSLFVTPAAYPDEFNNSYGWEFYKRFFNIFRDRNLPNFQEDNVETYFAAAYSVAIGKDMRDILRLWGFTIEDDYFDETYNILSNEI